MAYRRVIHHKEVGQQALFDVPPDWAAQWQDMPAFVQEDQAPHSSINVQFRSGADRTAFLLMLGEHPDRQKSIWYPQQGYVKQSVINAPAVQAQPNQYPIYIISKGRWKSRLTSKALEKLGIAYYIVIEPQEYDAYAAVIDAAKILMLPFQDLGQGSIPARNWVWDHALSSGADKHWILDDNMDGFYRLNNNLKTKVIEENPFTPIEQFCDRYSNIALAGMQYEFFAARRAEHPPFLLNTRIYSCILIQHAIPYRWRGRYNEDTDLSLRALKDGWCTVLFNAYLCKKMPTMQMAGGNTDELYQEDGRLRMAQSLYEQHPDAVTITEKWGRPQHHVNYKIFKHNKLILKPGIIIPGGAAEYGMVLETQP